MRKCDIDFLPSSCSESGLNVIWESVTEFSGGKTNGDGKKRNVFFVVFSDEMISQTFNSLIQFLRSEVTTNSNKLCSYHVAYLISL